MNQEKLEKAKKLLFIMLCIDIAVNAISGIDSYTTSITLEKILSGHQTFTQDLADSAAFWGNFEILGILTLLGVGAALVNWLNTCYRFAKESIRATGFKKESWIILGWIIPILNLFIPYQIINELYKAGSPNYLDGDNWKKESGSCLLLTWWLFWAVSHFFIWIIARASFGKIFSSNFTLQSDISLQHFISLYQFLLFSSIFSIVIAILWFAIVEWLTKRLINHTNNVQNMTTTEIANKNTEIHDRFYKNPSYVGDSEIKPAPVSQVKTPQNDDVNSYFDFNDEKKDTSPTDNYLEKNWSVALKYYNDLQDIDSRLSKISKSLSYKFRTYILKEKLFNERQKIADEMEHNFFKIYFGENKKIIDFATYLIMVIDNKQAAKSLSEAVRVLGNTVDHYQIIRQIKYEFGTIFKRRLKVIGINEKSEAERLGIKMGDVFYSYCDAPITSNNGLTILMEHYKGQQHILKVIRGQQQLDFYVTAGPLGIMAKETVDEY